MEEKISKEDVIQYLRRHGIEPLKVVETVGSLYAKACFDALHRDNIGMVVTTVCIGNYGQWVTSDTYYYNEQIALIDGHKFVGSTSSYLLLRLRKSNNDVVEVKLPLRYHRIAEFFYMLDLPSPRPLLPLLPIL